MPGASLWILLPCVLFTYSFGLTAFTSLFLFLVFFLVGCFLVLLYKGYCRSDDLLADFKSSSLEFARPRHLNFQCFRSSQSGLADPEDELLANRLTGCPKNDAIITEIMELTLRDYVNPWYCALTTDEYFMESLRLTASKIVGNLSIRAQNVDWVPFFTKSIINDFASHIRLYRSAMERLEQTTKDGDQQGGELESLFFDMELAMEKSYCRDLVSTDPQYEKAYLRDLINLILYLVLPKSELGCKPLTLLLREFLISNVFQNVIDLLSEPDYVNHTIVWLLSTIPLTPEDFLTVLEWSEDEEELMAVAESLDHEIMSKRSKDTGGSDDYEIKQQLSSLEYVRTVVDQKLMELRRPTRVSESGTPPGSSPDRAKPICDLSLSFVLHNSIAVSYFIDFLQASCDREDSGQNLVFLFLAVKGFKVSAEHYLNTARMERDAGTSSKDRYAGDLESIREAALTLYEQYMSERALCRSNLDSSLLRKVYQKLKTTQPQPNWFDPVQSKVLELLGGDPRYFSAFKRSPMYLKLLAELDLLKDAVSSSSSSEESGFDRVHSTDAAATFATADNAKPSNLNAVGGVADMVAGGDEDAGVTLHAEIAQIAVSKEGNKAFAVYFIHVTALRVSGEVVASWNILRRYSDFLEMHLLIEQQFFNIADLEFPGKKTFNNLNQEFLEKRRKALNEYLKSLLDPKIAERNPGLDNVIATFLMKGNYDKGRAYFGKKMDSASLMNPILSGVKTVGSAVVSMPDTFVDGVFKMSGGLGRMTKSMFGVSSMAGSVLSSSGAQSGNYSLSPNSAGGEGPMKQSLSSSNLSTSSHNSGATSTSSSNYALCGDPWLGASSSGGNGSKLGVAPPASSTGSSSDLVGDQFVAAGGQSDNIPLGILLLLMDEVFNLRQRNTWFRRRLITVLQTLIRTTFGSSINKKIVDFVLWITSANQMAEYLTTFKDYFWPGGKLAEGSPEPRPKSIQLKTSVVAKAKMIAALPDELRLCIGNDTTRRGIFLVFKALQNPRLNRRFCYVLLERFLITLFPQNRFEQTFQKLHSKSPRFQG